jgi:hypothetical protein
VAEQLEGKEIADVVVYDPNLLGIVGDAFMNLEIPHLRSRHRHPRRGLERHRRQQDGFPGGKPLGEMTDYYQ